MENNEGLKNIRTSRNTTITDIKHEDSTFNKDDKYNPLSPHQVDRQLKN